MTTTIEELEKRVVALEREVSYLRQQLGIWTPGQTLVESERDHEEIKAIWARVLEQLGIHGEPIGAEKLRERMLASGIKPEDNMLSRGIIEAREE
jgi:hypothetical protein